MTVLTLTNEDDNYEWLADSGLDSATNLAHSIAGGTSVAAMSVQNNTISQPYRCWLPR